MPRVLDVLNTYLRAVDLAGARLAAAEGHPEEAVRALTALIEADGHASVEALTELVRIVLDAGLAIPDRVVTDLRAAALQYRGAAVEAELRALLVEALAQRAELPAALEETRAAMGNPRPRRLASPPWR